MTDTPPSIFALVALAVGLIFGSFFNVVIVRLPKKESLWFPPSHCMSCQEAIRWHDNIPLLSFVWLRGRCRNCSARIGWRYPIVEALNGVSWAFAVGHFGLTLRLLPALILLSTLIALTMIDLEHQIIPDRITLPGILVGWLLNLVTGQVPILHALLGSLIGGGIFYLVVLLSGGGMGGGDVKLGAMIGAFFGWKLTLLTIFIAVFAGGLVAASVLVSGRKGRKDPLPFGPFLALGAVATLFWGEELLQWYLSVFQG
jgi:leader peptidase (prepilin peptidase)/N-methyltransferase